MAVLRAPFPYFGGKSAIASAVWERLGRPKQYVEPFCGSAAMLLAAPKPASLEVVGDLNCYVANFWRAVKFQPDAVTSWQDYPVSHIDLGARHRWLVEPARVATLRDALGDPEWPGDAQIAGWWLWGQCAWIGDGWCNGRGTVDGIPHVSDAGVGTQSTTASAAEWIRTLSARLARVRLIHGSWDRCMSTHYGTHLGGVAAVFFDPPYKSFERLYAESAPVAAAVEEWCRAEVTGQMRVALCGHVGDYDLPGWTVMPWTRTRPTFSSSKTRDAEAVWFSPACLDVAQRSLFEAAL